MARRFEDLIIWQKARRLVSDCFDLTELPSLDKKWSFQNQLSTAALSVMNNIAEGFDRGGDKQFAQFLRISKASAAEVRSMFYVMLDRKWISLERFEELHRQVTDIAAGIQSLTRYLEQSSPSKPTPTPDLIRDSLDWPPFDLPQSLFQMEENHGRESSSAAESNSNTEEPHTR